MYLYPLGIGVANPSQQEVGENVDYEDLLMGVVHSLATSFPDRVLVPLPSIWDWPKEEDTRQAGLSQQLLVEAMVASLS